MNAGGWLAGCMKNDVGFTDDSIIHPHRALADGLQNLALHEKGVIVLKGHKVR